MKKTENLGLNILEGSDPISVEGFNENANLLDTVVSKKCTMAHGTWTGDDTNNKTLTFEKPPVLVIICNNGGVFFCFQGRPMSLYHNFTSYAQIGRPISWSEDGCSLILPERNFFNYSQDGFFQYIAFLEH